MALKHPGLTTVAWEMAVGPRAKKRWLFMWLLLQPQESLLDGVMGGGLREQSPENWGRELRKGYGGRRWNGARSSAGACAGIVQEGSWGRWEGSRALPGRGCSDGEEKPESTSPEYMT